LKRGNYATHTSSGWRPGTNLELFEGDFSTD